MKKGTTIFLKMAIILMGLPVLALSIWGMISLIQYPANKEYAWLLYPIVGGVYLASIPYYFGLYQSFRLLCLIDKNQAFSHQSVTGLRNIKYCGLVISAIFVVLMPFIFMVAEKDDAPGLIIFAMLPIFAAMVVAVFSAVLERLLKEAIDIKSENDLTV